MAKAIVTLLKSTGPRVHVAFEEGTQAEWLHDLTVPLAERVIVCKGQWGHARVSGARPSIIVFKKAAPRATTISKEKTRLDNRFHRTLRCTGLVPVTLLRRECVTIRVRLQAGELGPVRRQ